MSEKISLSGNKPHAGMRAMEEAAEKVLGTDAERARIDAIEARKLSPEVQALNDKAELELFGSRGRTYTDPVTGEVIATPEKPIIGKIESILTDHKYGGTYKERKEHSERYQNHLEYLLGQGLELSQAKLVCDMDDIVDDQNRYGKQVGNLVAQGVAPEEASRRVMEQLAKVSELRLKRVLEGGVFTKEDYEAVKNGKDLYEDGKFKAAEKSQSPDVSSESAKEDEILTDEEKKYAQTWADASSLDRVEMVNAAAGQNEASSLSETGADVLKNLDKIKGKKAAEIVRKAIENGYVLSKDFDTKDSVADDSETNSTTTTGEKAQNATKDADSKNTVAEMHPDASEDPEVYHKAFLENMKLSPEGEENRNKDMVALFKGLDSNERKKILEAAFGDKMNEKFDELEGQGIHSVEDLLKEENNSVLAGIVNDAVNNGYRFPDRKFTAPSAYDFAATNKIDMQDADTEILEQVDEPRGIRGAFSRLKNIREKYSGLTRRQKAAGALGLALTGMGIAAGSYIAFKSGTDTETLAQVAQGTKDALKQSVGPLGAPGAARHAAEQAAGALEHVPVPDGSGGYQLIDTLNNALHVKIPKEVWDAHQHEFANMFPQYTYDMGNGQIGLLDKDMTTNVSNYDLSKMKDLVAAWTQSR